MLSDCHAHLTAWEAPDRGRIVSAAEQEGVEVIVASAMNIDDCYEVVQAASAFPVVFAAVGIHPWNPEPWSQELYQTLKGLALSPKVVAVSEVGLDWIRGPRDLQTPLLEGEIRLAQELGLPLILHCREAHDEMMRLLRAAPGVKGAVHGFSGAPAQLNDWLNLGFCVSMGRGLLRPEAPQWEGIVKDIPEDRLLLETDAYTGPAIAGEAAGPAGVATVAQRVAHLRGVEFEAVGQVATANLKRLLGLPA